MLLVQFILLRSSVIFAADTAPANGGQPVELAWRMQAVRCPHKVKDSLR